MQFNLTNELLSNVQLAHKFVQNSSLQGFKLEAHKKNNYKKTKKAD